MIVAHLHLTCPLDERRQCGEGTNDTDSAFCCGYKHTRADLVGNPASSPFFYFFSENTGFLGLTRVGSRRVIQISAGIMLFFSVLGKFGAVLASIPLPIVAALYCVLFAYVDMSDINTRLYQT